MKKYLLCIIPLMMIIVGCASKPSTNSSDISLDQAIAEAAVRIIQEIDAERKIALLNFSSSSDLLSSYVLDELMANIVDSKKLTVVDRREVDLIRRELDFQFSGDVADDSMQELGRMLGAQSIISGSLTEIGRAYRIVIRVLDVQTATVAVQYRTDIVNDERVQALLTGNRLGGTAMNASGGRADDALSTTLTPTQPIVSAPLVQPPVNTPSSPANTTATQPSTRTINLADFEWRADGSGGIIITGYTGAGGTVVIPSEINKTPVRSIGVEAFWEKKLTNVIIPDSVISIGDRAFANNLWSDVNRHNQLTSVTIPTSVTSIGDSVFFNNQLTSVVISNRVIGTNMFSHNKLARVNIPNGVTLIGGGAFWKNHLTSVTIPESVTSIGGAAFSENQLTSVIIPNSVTSIEGYTFKDNQLISIIIPNSVTSIGELAFSGNKLTSVTIPNRVTSIGTSAFSGNQLTSVIIPNSVTSIDRWAFSRNQLTSVTIPNSVTSIGEFAFSNNQMTSITLGANVELGLDIVRPNALVGTPDFFTDAYNTTNRSAGTYIKNTSGNWFLQP